MITPLLSLIGDTEFIMAFVSPQETIIPKKYFTNEALDYFCSKVCKTGYSCIFAKRNYRVLIRFCVCVHVCVCFRVSAR